MADAVAHARTVLSAVVAGTGSVKALEYASARLEEEHFTDPVQRKLFLLLVWYMDQYGGIMSRKALSDLLRGKRPGTSLMYGEAYDAMAALAPEPHEFRHSVDQLRDLAADRATGDALATGMQIMRDEVRLDDGRVLSGHADAREYVLASFADAERAGGASDSPGGNVTGEGDDILAAYVAAKQLRVSGKVPGIQFGLKSLDDYLDGGLGDGEMAVVMAGTTAGKSSLCVQTAWHNAVMEGRNVLVFTTEQLRSALRVKIAARHSRLPKFGLPEGINSAAIRGGRLTEGEESALVAVLADLKNGPYGQLNVVQMPQRCTVSVMAARAAAIARSVPPDLVVVDYLQLFSPERAGRDAREYETLAGIIKAAHRWAQTFMDGRGVPLITPWQSSREGRKQMKVSGGFSLDDLSATDEASRTPGVVLALSNADEDRSFGRRTPLEVTVLKNRDGPRGKRFPLTADFATSCFTDRDEAGGDYLGLDG
jgi:KaiC/GvpD/RAD55 family RecA-like ATPase